MVLLRNLKKALRAYAIQELDELSADDTLEKALTGTAIAEPPTTSPRSLSLQIEAVLRVHYSLPQGEQGSITLYDPTGRRIESLRVKGEDKVSFKSELTAGVYFVRLETGHSSVVRKAVFID